MKNAKEMKSLCDPNSISFSPSEIIQTLQKSIEEAVANAADTLQGLDMKQQEKELADELKKSANGMADAVKKAACARRTGWGRRNEWRSSAIPWRRRAWWG